MRSSGSGLRPSSTDASFQPRLNASCIDTFMPWPALALCVWQASPAMKTRGRRDADLLGGHVVEPVGDALADLVDREPGDLLHVERVRVQHALRDRDDLLGCMRADGGAVVGSTSPRST